MKKQNNTKITINNISSQKKNINKEKNVNREKNNNNIKNTP